MNMGNTSVFTPAACWCIDRRPVHCICLHMYFLLNRYDQKYNKECNYHNTYKKNHSVFIKEYKIIHHRLRPTTRKGESIVNILTITAKHSYNAIFYQHHYHERIHKLPGFAICEKNSFIAGMW